MSNSLGGITNADIRDTMGDRCTVKAGVVIDETNTENVKLTTAVAHLINGVYQTDFAVAAEIDLSDTAEQIPISAKDGAVLSGTTAIPVLAAGDDSVTKYWVLACAGDQGYIVEPEVDTAGTDNADYPLICPKGYAPYAVIKVVCAPTPSVGVVTFVLGTTALTGVTGQTVTFFDVTHLPPTGDLLIEL